ncbi:hypothetical protein PGT21_001876 [Puccinia graminis f. sp. tritici]|uniref:N-acetyltransferase O1 (Establishment of cohesion protein 1) n=1 Tax=Puccinia graminis f. sp. tritici TaxID=56615 RepID=A0A5B0NMD8_PUCGR|nr:hypothetical protein PGT21_001876 [Puccinia graminis f. sp. tritici]KAA1127802.1 hypothetical protein PGTUg99_003286 [Puccinia graminis f. sp. tritici]
MVVPPARPRGHSTSTSESADRVLTSPLVKTTVRVVVPKLDDDSKRQRSTDIRSFFASATAPHAHQKNTPISSSPATTVLRTSPLTSPSSSRTLPTRKRTRLSDKKTINKQSSKTRRPMMSQLMLDLSNRPTTQICKECGMSFVLGVEEDVELHKKHHRRVVEGVEWPMTLLESQPDCRVVWREPGGMEEEKIVKVSLDPQSLKRSRYKHKVEQILEMVNRSLDAQELTEDQLRASSLYIYLGSPMDRSTGLPEPKKRRLSSGLSTTPKSKKKKVVVKAMCVAARIEHGYQIVRGPGNPGEEELDDAELLRFGETSSELYCSPKAEKTLIGIHRIWSSPHHRRAGLSRRLLDVVAGTFIYGMAIDGIEARRRSIAFSQPTESGMRLAADWFQTVLFKIFID